MSASPLCPVNLPITLAHLQANRVFLFPLVTLSSFALTALHAITGSYTTALSLLSSAHLFSPFLLCLRSTPCRSQDLSILAALCTHTALSTATRVAALSSSCAPFCALSFHICTLSVHTCTASPLHVRMAARQDKPLKTLYIASRVLHHAAKVEDKS